MKNVERGNSKGSSGSTFWQISQKYFAAVSQQNFEEINRWLTHQSKAPILDFDTENQSISFSKILWKTDKRNFIFSNLMFVYTHPKFKNIKFLLYVFHKIFKK